MVEKKTQFTLEAGDDSQLSLLKVQSVDMLNDQIDLLYVNYEYNILTNVIIWSKISLFIDYLVQIGTNAMQICRRKKRRNWKLHTQWNQCCHTIHNNTKNSFILEISDIVFQQFLRISSKRVTGHRCDQTK